MHLDEVIQRVWRYTWRQWWRECVDALRSNEVHRYILSITVQWNGEACRQTANHQHSAAPCMATKGNVCGSAVLAWGALKRGERIWMDTWPPWTTQIAWIYEAWQQCIRPRAGQDRVCISYNEMMSIYPGVSKIYTACRWVHLCYSSIPICV
jgi:hypothetical protein